MACATLKRSLDFEPPMCRPTKRQRCTPMSISPSSSPPNSSRSEYVSPHFGGDVIPKITAGKSNENCFVPSLSVHTTSNLSGRRHGYLKIKTLKTIRIVRKWPPLITMFVSSGFALRIETEQLMVSKSTQCPMNSVASITFHWPLISVALICVFKRNHWILIVLHYDSHYSTISSYNGILIGFLSFNYVFYPLIMVIYSS